MKRNYRLESIKYLLRDISAKLLTVNDLINAHFQINVSYLINASSMLCVLGAPCLINAPYENYFRLLGISKKEQNHSIHSVSFLINKALHISSCSMLSLK